MHPVVIKQPGLLRNLVTPIHLLEASGAPAFTLQQEGWIYCTQEAALSQRAARCCLHHSGGVFT